MAGAALAKLLSKLAPKIIKKTGQEPAKKWTRSEIKNKAVWKQIEKIIDPSPKDLSTKKARMAVTAQQKGALQAAEGIDKSNPNRAEIIKLTRESVGESSPSRRLTDVDEFGRPLSKHIPPWDESVKDRTGFKKASTAQKRKLIKTGMARVDKKGRLVSTGKWAASQETVAKEMGIKPASIPKDAAEQAKYEGTIKKKGGKVGKTIYKKHGGQIGTPRGVGAALRGYGKGYK
tara:strand:+ start:121 stop:816 length:696 start_codon:yes stop_codon:yes gene_type:complete